MKTSTALTVDPPKEMALPVGQTVDHHRRIKAAYDAYLRQLQEYLAVLPAQSLQGLGDSARDLYNLFNRENPFSEQIHALRLPRAKNGRIELMFLGQPGEVFDAVDLERGEYPLRCCHWTAPGH